MSIITLSQPRRISSFPLVQGIEPCSYFRRLLTPSKTQRFFHFLSIGNSQPQALYLVFVSVSTTCSSWGQQLRGSLFLLYLIILSFFISGCYESIIILQYCDRVQAINRSYHFPLVIVINQGIVLSLIISPSKHEGDPHEHQVICLYFYISIPR